MSADQQTLLDQMVREGYSKSVCSPLSSPDGESLATFDCNALTNGPQVGRFWLYPSINTLSNGFESLTKKLALVTCPGSQKAPDTWHYDNSPDKTAGQLACGNKGNTPALLWTDDAKNFMGYVEGTSIDDLYKWWTHK